MKKWKYRRAFQTVSQLNPVDVSRNRRFAIAVPNIESFPLAGLKETRRIVEPPLSSSAPRITQHLEAFI